MRTEKHRKLRSEIAKKLWSNDSYRNMVIKATSEAQKSEKCKLKRSKSCKKMWENHEFRDKMSRIMNSPEFRDNMSKKIEQMYRDRPDVRIRQMASWKKTMEKPETKTRMSAAAKLRYKNSAKMQNMLKNRTGENNPVFGSRWMHDPKTMEIRKIQKAHVEEMLSKGWNFGRIRIVKKQYQNSV